MIKTQYLQLHITKKIFSIFVLITNFGCKFVLMKTSLYFSSSVLYLLV